MMNERKDLRTRSIKGDTWSRTQKEPGRKMFDDEDRHTERKEKEFEVRRKEIEESKKEIKTQKVKKDREKVDKEDRKGTSDERSEEDRRELSLQARMEAPMLERGLMYV